MAKLKTNVISAAAEKKQCLLHGEASLTACSRGLVQYDLVPYHFFACVLARSRYTQSARGRGGERTVDCIGKRVPVDFYTKILIPTLYFSFLQ